MTMINILIVDDSPTETAILKCLFQSEADMHIVGCARNGREAIEMANQLKPDIITMDIHMPFMDGLEAIKIIMAQCPTPIVVISSKINDTELNISFHALESGALSVLAKPQNLNSAESYESNHVIVQTIRNMAGIKVVRRRLPAKQNNSKPSVAPKLIQGQFEIVAIGTSVGGPQALKKILIDLPASFPVPIVIVQHMAPGFISGFAQWLDTHIALHVKCAEDFEILNAGTVYFAPDQHHLALRRINGKLAAHLHQADPISGFRPSATALLESTAKMAGEKAVGILLTGMGSDGAQGLLTLKQMKGLTLIQDKNSAVVFGMPGVAQALGAVEKVVELEHFAEYLRLLFGGK